MFSVFVYLAVITATSVDGARILAVIPSPAYSHQHAFHPIWRELSLRGHNMTLVTTDPVEAPELTNLTQIDVSFAYKYMKRFYNMMQHLNVLNTASFLQTTLNNISEAELSDAQVRRLIKSEEPFDLVLVESSFPDFLAFGEIYKCPTILISSMELQSLIHKVTGNPAHPVLNPEFVLPFYGKLTFKERVISTLYQIVVNYFRENKAFPGKQSLIETYFGKPMPSIMNMLNKVSMVFISVNPILHDVRALGPATVTFDGLQLKPLQPLPKSPANAARILAFIPMASYSHQYAFHPIWKELSLRGHNVTILTTDPLDAPELSNLTQINAKSTYKIMKSLQKKLPHAGFTKGFSDLHSAFNKMTDHQLSLPEIQRLITSNEPVDLVITESLFPEFLAFGEIYKCPTILISSAGLQSLIHKVLGNPVHPVLSPEGALPFHWELSFKERLISTLYQVVIDFAREFIEFPLKERTLLKYFGNSIPSIMDMLRKVDMVLLGVNPVLYDIRALGPTTIAFGGLHLKPLQPLPKDLKNYLDSAHNGFIYFSLGTNVQSHLLTKEKLNVILDTLGELPYKILWKYASDELPEIPSNVKIMKWIPQQDVLRHPNIKLFITQGGLQSTEESIMYGVPMLIMPFFGDQPYNAKRLEFKKLGKIVFHQSLKKETLKELIMEVITNPMYKENTKKLAALAKDQPMTGLEKVVWWIEYVIRHRGAKHLRNPAADIPLYQYYLLDIAAFFAVVIFSMWILWKVLLKFLMWVLQMAKRKLKDSGKVKSS